MIRIVLACILMGITGIAGAADTRFEDPQKQARYDRLVNELRCLVCQNQTIADSNADLATDLRDKVATMIAEGRSDEEIIEFLTARYGDFVLYRPPVQGNTILLWIGPFLLLGGGLVVLLLTLRRRAAAAENQENDNGGAA